MSTDGNRTAANALAGKTARACDSCLVKRARLFCIADEAFLCQACDSSVHSANQLASRHKRVLLETSSHAPAWRQGVTKKARTPRTAKSSRGQMAANHPLAVVPEINGDDPFADENEEQLLYRVPVFEPFDEELFWRDDHDLNLDELTEFAADVECLLAAETEESNKSDGILDVKMEEEEEDDDDHDDHDEVEAVIASHFDPALDMELHFDFDFASDIKSVVAATIDDDTRESKIATRDEPQGNKNKLLRLDYEAVISAWDTQGSPWMNGSRPHEFNLVELTVNHSEGVSNVYRVLKQQSEVDDAGRKARVTRYREKRRTRTRLFSNKIRYQVRKLNAETRPRMKGRFVKKETFAVAGMNK